MTQSNPTIGANKSGLTYRQEDNDGKKALLTHHKGPGAPPYAEAGTIWIDDSATPWLMKFHDGSDWIILADINAATNAVNFYQGTAATRLLTHATTGGTASAYTLAPVPALADYAIGQTVIIKPIIANTGTVTLAVSGLAAKSIKMPDGSNPPPNAMIPSGTYILVYDGTSFVLANPSRVIGNIAPGITGYTVSNNSFDNVNDVDISSGCCSDSTCNTIIKTSAAVTKRLDAAWAAGSGNGGRDAGAIADGTWFIHVIQNPETNDVDFLFSLSRFSPALPAGYSYFRCVGCVIRSGGTIIQFAGFRERGQDVLYAYAAPVLDVNVTNLGTTTTSYTVTSPANGSYCAVLGQGLFSHATPGTVFNVNHSQGIFGTLPTPSNAAAPLGVCVSNAANQFVSTGLLELVTTDNPSIRACSSAPNTTFRWASLGFIFYRSK